MEVCWKGINGEFEGAKMVILGWLKWWKKVMNFWAALDDFMNFKKEISGKVRKMKWLSEITPLKEGWTHKGRWPLISLTNPWITQEIREDKLTSLQLKFWLFIPWKWRSLYSQKPSDLLQLNTPSKAYSWCHSLLLVTAQLNAKHMWKFSLTWSATSLGFHLIKSQQLS